MRWLWTTIALALGYAGLGWVTAECTRSTEFGAPFWPPAGLAFTAVLLGGYRLAPGVWLGSLLTNLFLALDRDGRITHTEAVTSNLFAMGAAAQALVGSWLVRRTVGAANPLTSPRDIYLFLVLAVPGHTLVNATWSTAWLVGCEAIALEQAGLTWLLWWIGDSFGTLAVVLPALTLLGSPKQVWRRRLFTTALPGLLLVGLAIGLYFLARGWERRQLTRELEAFAELAAEGARERLHKGWAGVEDWANRISTLGPDAQGTTHAAARILEERDPLTALVYAAWVPPGRIGQLEAEQRRAGRAGFRLRWPDGRPPDESTALSCVTAGWPPERVGPMHGLVISALPALAAPLRQTAATSTRHVTYAPTAFAGVPASGCLLCLAPVYRPNRPLQSEQQRLDALLGHVVGVLALPDLRDRVAQGAVYPEVLITLSRPSEAAADEGGSWSATRVACVRRFQLAGVPVEVSVTGGKTYLAHRHFRFLWLILLFGLVTNLLMTGVLLTITGHTVQVEQVVRQRTEQLRVEIGERQEAEAAVEHARAELEQRVTKRTAELQQANERLAREIADRLRAEAEVRQALAFQESIIGTAAEGICVCHEIAEPPFVRFTVWNERMTALTGYTIEEMNRPEWYQTVFPDPEVQRRARERIARMHHGDDLRDEEWAITHRDGNIRYLSCSTSMAPPGPGAPAVIALVHDVTDRHRAEQGLRESESRLRALVTTAIDGIITITRDGRIDSVNPAAEQMFGYRREELIGQNVRLLMPSPFREEHDSYLRDYHRTSVKKIIGIGREVQALRKDGTTFPIDLTVSEIGELGLYTGIIRDSTARKQMEREVLEATSREQARIGQELHDGVGQELTGLSLTADAIAQRLRSRDAPEAALAERLTDGLVRVHEQVRALSHGLVPVEVDAEGLRAALETLAARTTAQTGVECTFACEGRCEVADTLTATHLYRIVQEAVSNALRHARPNTIAIHWRMTAGLLTLSVRDDGCGFTPPPVSSAGLGTRLMRYRAGMIGGHLTVARRPEDGTEVVCTLPVRDSSTASEPCEDTT